MANSANIPMDLVDTNVQPSNMIGFEGDGAMHPHFQDCFFNDDSLGPNGATNFPGYAFSSDFFAGVPMLVPLQAEFQELQGADGTIDSNSSVISDTATLVDPLDTTAETCKLTQNNFQLPSPSLSHVSTHASLLLPFSEEMLEQAQTPKSQENEKLESDDILNRLIEGIAPHGDGKFYCRQVNAEDHSCDFSADRRCMLRKHLECTLKTNMCLHPECHGTRFSSKAVLTRHQKEAHKMHKASHVFCPVETCSRRVRGFPREYNLGDHISRVHKDLDVGTYLKKTKRSVKKNALRQTGSGSKKPTKSRREAMEKQFKSSRNKLLDSLIHNIVEPGSDAGKHIQQLKLEFNRLEEANLALKTNQEAPIAPTD